MQACHYRLLAVLFVAIVELHATASFAMESKTAEIIAAQLRRQGVACTTPRSAARDTENSAPHEIVWKLQCDEATYLITLVPHVGAAHIMPICGNDQRDPSAKNSDVE